MLQNNWVALFAIVLLSFIIGKVVQIYGGKVLKKFISSNGFTVKDKDHCRATASIGYILTSGCIALFLPLINMEPSTASLVLRLARVALTLSMTFSAYYGIHFFCLYLEKKALESEHKFDDILVPIIRKSAKFLVIVMGLISLGNALTLDMKGIIAGLGIGGLALAFAARDTIANLFGSITIILDHPFSIGDWIKLDDETEGVVEEVGLRSCRIRTFYDSLITIPNGKLTNINIDNYGRREYRRISTMIAIEYNTPPQKIEAFCEGIRSLIHLHPHTRKENYHIYLNNLGESALEIMLYVFWKVPSWGEELAQRHRLLMDILRLGENLEIQFAFPTWTMHTIPTKGPTYSPIPPEGFKAYGQKEAQKVVERQN